MPERVMLGGLVPTLTEQGLGPWLAPEDLERFEADVRAVSRLYLRHIITYSQSQKAYEKLSRAIVKAVREYAPEARNPAQQSGRGEGVRDAGEASGQPTCTQSPNQQER